MAKKHTNGFSHQKALKIGIDARLFDESGVGRYIRNLVFHLAEIDTYNHYYLFLLKKNIPQKFPRNIIKVEANYGWYGVDEQLKLPRLLAKYDLDLMHFPHFNIPLFYRGKFIVTIHDLLHQHFSMSRATTLDPISYRVKRAGYARVFHRSVSKATKIITPSEFVKEQLTSEWNVDEDKIIVTHEAVEESLIATNKKITNEDFKKLAKKYSVNHPYLYYVGNAHPHKNVERLIRVFASIHQKFPHIQLVVSGPEDYFWTRIKKEGLGEGVVATGFVTDRELVTFYKNALAYVMPSLEEGFGIPLLEAMATGTPVVCSKAGSLPEVAGKAALFFDPTSDEDILKKLSKLIKDESLQKELVQKGNVRVKEFSWDTLAKQTLQIYKSV
jgi:glycosyltransferase involved in cell wall biosynthesis